MACNTVTLNGINAKCDTSAGGIKRVLIAQKDDVTIGETNAQGVITEITMATGKYFVQWLFRKNTGSYTTSLTSDPAIGTQAVTTDLNLQFTKAEATKRLEIQSAINAAAVVIIEDMYGQYILLGKDNEVSVTAVNQQSGTAVTDLNGYTLTFQDVSLELPHFVDASIIPSLLSAQPAQPEE
jgi:hypothetical protein